jgi:hypothetical protein
MASETPLLPPPPTCTLLAALNSPLAGSFSPRAILLRAPASSASRLGGSGLVEGAGGGGRLADGWGRGLGVGELGGWWGEGLLGAVGGRNSTTNDPEQSG